jgi:hypothetical protein
MKETIIRSGEVGESVFGDVRMRGIENQYEFVDPGEGDLPLNQFEGGPRLFNIGVRASNFTVFVFLILALLFYIFLILTSPETLGQGSAVLYFGIVFGGLILLYPFIILMAMLRASGYLFMDHLWTNVRVDGKGLTISYLAGKGWWRTETVHVLFKWSDISDVRPARHHPEVSLLDLWIRAFIPARGFQKGGSNYSPFVPVCNIVVIGLNRKVRIRKFRARERKDGSFDTEQTKMVLMEIKRKDRQRFMELVDNYLRPGT